MVLYGTSKFLLTRPSRGATSTNFKQALIVCISTHTPLAGRDLFFVPYRRFRFISTHTPLAGRDISRERIFMN